MCNINGKRIPGQGEKVEIDPSATSSVLAGYQNIIQIYSNVDCPGSSTDFGCIAEDTAIGECLAAIITGLDQTICV